MQPNYRAPAGEHELALYAACVGTLQAQKGQLDLVGLAARIRGVTDLPNDGAELTIDFEGPGGIADVLEFTITRGGLPTLDASRLRNWLEEVLPTVIEG